MMGANWLKRTLTKSKGSRVMWDLAIRQMMESKKAAMALPAFASGAPMPDGGVSLRSTDDLVVTSYEQTPGVREFIALATQ